MRKKKNDSLKSYVQMAVHIILLIAIVFIFVTQMKTLSKKTQVKGIETLRDGIARASVQCYAIEGRYPPDIKYLEDNYGIQIDYNKYNVFYSGFASNIMPEITVNLSAEVK